jgi:hypothetical protein
MDAIGEQEKKRRQIRRGFEIFQESIAQLALAIEDVSERANSAGTFMLFDPISAVLLLLASLFVFELSSSLEIY